MAFATKIQFGKGLDVTDEGSGVIQVDALATTVAISGAPDTSTATGNITGLAITNAVWRWNGASAADLHGIAGGTEGRVVIIENVSTTQVLTLRSNSATEGTAANRIRVPNDRNTEVNVHEMVVLIYDATDSRWRINGTARVDAVFPGTFTTSTATGDIVGLQTTAAVWRWNGASAATLHGIDITTHPAAGRLVVISNITTSQTLTLAHGSTTETTANWRILLPAGAPMALRSGEAVLLVYDTMTDRWRALTYRGDILSRNASTAQQTPGSAEAYITSSGILIPSYGLRVGQVYQWQVCIEKTAAGTAAIVVKVYTGANQSTADTVRATLTQTVPQAATASANIMFVSVVVRSIGASGVLVCSLGFTGSQMGDGDRVVAAGFDMSSLGGQYIGISITGGASAAYTIDSVFGYLIG